MPEYLYEMETTDSNGNKVVLKTNDREEYSKWLLEIKQRPAIKKESKRILLTD